MPLPPLPANNTARFRVNYNVAGHDHSFQIRSVASPATIGAHINQFLTALSPLLYVLTVLNVEWAPAGSDVFNPVVTGSEGAIFGAGSPSSIALEALAINFIARTSGGRRVRRAIFGILSGGNNFRFTPGESGTVDAAIAVLVGAGSTLQGIDGGTPLWKPYANAKYFDHWVKEVRS